MELKEIFEIISLGSSLVFPAIGWTTRNVVAKWRSDALVERIKDKEDIKTWIEDRFVDSKEVNNKIQQLKEGHDQLCTKVERNEERLRIVEQFRWQLPTRSNPDAHQ